MPNHEETSKPRRHGKSITIIVVAALLIYVGVMLGPYLRSTLVRDAAVTTWINTATSPIYGEVALPLPKPGDRVGEDGVLIRIVNNKADRSAYVAAQSELARAEASVSAAKDQLTELQKAMEELERKYEAHKAVYMAELKAELDGVSQRLERTEARRRLLERLLKRKADAAGSDPSALDDLDELELRLEVERRQAADLKARKRVLAARQAAALEGTIVLDDGSVPDWGTHAMQQLGAALAQARFQHTEAEAALVAAQAQAEAAEISYQQKVRHEVVVPQGAVLWSTIVGEGAAVDVGTPVATWVDCNALLVDVPVADAEIPLLRAGSPATVIFEGE